MNIAAIIVTYNRKELLVRCVQAVVNQTLRLQTLYIVDNNSTDGTDELLYKNGIVNDTNTYNDINIEYIKLPKNGGGSLGFYEGLRRAHKTNLYDAFWVMDDDGMPDKDCLKELALHIKEYDYLSPLVVDIEDKKSMAFKEVTMEDYIKTQSIDGVFIKNSANPFNGILFSKQYLDKVGYPTPGMFIWGDEINYDLRGRMQNMAPVTICKAIHYHPRNRAQHSQPFLFKKKKVIFVDCKWKMYCRCCNAIYNYMLERNYIQVVKEFTLYNWLFIISMHSWDWIKLYNKAFINGLRGNFGGHYKYMNKN